jgi:hypothetical protein
VIPVGTGFAAKSVDTKLSPTRGEVGGRDLANCGAHSHIISAAGQKHRARFALRDRRGPIVSSAISALALACASRWLFCEHRNKCMCKGAIKKGRQAQPFHSWFEARVSKS